MIGGAVGSAKTSLLNSCLHYLRTTPLRVFIAEDDPEILCTIADCARMWAVKGVFGLREMVQDALRGNPNLIVVGELRGGEALELLKCFRTGHGGLTTVHCETMDQMPERLEELVLEVAATPMQRTIGAVLDVLVHMQRTETSWRCTAIGEMHGWDRETGDYDLRRVA
jgi:Flp pilus assembly CpaF family ATPase